MGRDSSFSLNKPDFITIRPQWPKGKTYAPASVGAFLFNNIKGILGFRFQFSVLKWMGVCGAEKSAPDKKEINIYILIKLYNIYII